MKSINPTNDRILVKPIDEGEQTYGSIVIPAPDTTTKSVVTIVSTATLEFGSCFRYSSKNASEILSHTLSG